MDHYTPEAKAKRWHYIDITFQHGPIQEVGVNGAHIEDVIDLLINRLQGFQKSETRCSENAAAIVHLQEAQNWLIRRTVARAVQGVEGTSQPHQE